MNERIKELEVRVEQLTTDVVKHDDLIDNIQVNLQTLIHQVTQIRNALYLMALAIASNIPALQKIMTALSTLIGG